VCYKFISQFINKYHLLLRYKKYKVSLFTIVDFIFLFVSYSFTNTNLNVISLVSFVTIIDIIYFYFTL
jgi:hypothetical protein